MKKIISIIMIGMLCVTANAAAINWSLAGKSFGTSDGLNVRARDYYVAVFYASDLTDVEAALVTLGTDPSTSIGSLNTLLAGSDTTKTTGAATGVISSTLPSVSTISLFMVAFDATSFAGAQNYLVSGTVLSDAYEAPDNPTNMGIFDASSFSGSSWTPVPEPATAALAIAGLAMLIRRRK